MSGTAREEGDGGVGDDGGGVADRSEQREDGVGLVAGGDGIDRELDLSYDAGAVLAVAVGEPLPRVVFLMDDHAISVESDGRDRGRDGTGGPVRTWTSS